MRKLIAWIRANIAVIAATSVIAGAAAPSIKEVTDAVARAATAIATVEGVEQ